MVSELTRLYVPEKAMSIRVLLAEDDKILATGITRALQAADYTVDHVNSGDAADLAAQQIQYDALILDLGLPHVDGLDVIKHVRTSGKDVPILVITARDSVEERVRGLDLGADDYLTKPFELVELEGRLRAIMRRRNRIPPTTGREMQVRLNTMTRCVEVGANQVELSRTEFEIIEILMRHTGQVVGKQELVDLLSQANAKISLNAIEVYIHRLRKKLEPFGVGFRTIRGLGYLVDISAE